MIELEENKRELMELGKRIGSIGESLWLSKDWEENRGVRGKNNAGGILEWY